MVFKNNWTHVYTICWPDTNFLSHPTAEKTFSSFLFWFNQYPLRVCSLWLCVKYRCSAHIVSWHAQGSSRLLIFKGQLPVIYTVKTVGLLFCSWPLSRGLVAPHCSFCSRDGLFLMEKIGSFDKILKPNMTPVSMGFRDILLGWTCMWAVLY